ncbi:MAG: signal peptidase I [Gammaproteobacteria bacterium]|nr:signal peptidase I [Gammaproteobacteria bacterium]
MIDFAAILLIAGALTGLIWGLDSLLRRAGDKPLRRPALVELSRSLFPVIVIVLVLRSFVIEPFRIPSGSMLPTLLVGDFIVVNKFVYGLRLPVIHTQFFKMGAPRRGDVMVFRHPKDKVDYIKRVIGLPGDVVHYENKQLMINHKAATYEKKNVFLDQGKVLTLLEEKWENSPGDFFSHAVILDKNLPSSFSEEWVIPSGQYFVLGDNRDNSNDSRFWGMVPEDHVVGKAFGIWMNWSPEGNGLIPIRWSRIGHSIR